MRSIDKEPDYRRCIEYDEYLYSFVNSIPEAYVTFGKRIVYLDQTNTYMVIINRDYSNIEGTYDAEDMKHLLEIGAKICMTTDRSGIIAMYDNIEVYIPKGEYKKELKIPPGDSILILRNVPISFLRVFIEDDVESGGIYYDGSMEGIYILRQYNMDPHDMDKPLKYRYFVGISELNRYGIELVRGRKILINVGKEYWKDVYNLYSKAGISHIDLYMLRDTENVPLHVVSGQMEVYIAPRIVEDLEEYKEGTGLVLPKIKKFKVPRRKSEKVPKKERKKRKKIVKVEEVHEEVQVPEPPTREEVLKFLNSIDGTPEEKLRLLPKSYRDVLNDLIQDNVDSIVTFVKPPWYYKDKEYGKREDLYNLILNAYLLGEDVSTLIRRVIEETQMHAKSPIEKEEEQPPVEVPIEVKYFIDYNKLEVVGDIIAMEGVEGYDKDKRVYTFRVRDTVTGDVYTAYIPFPSNMEKYSIVRVANKDGKPVNIVARKEEEKKEIKTEVRESVEYVVEKKESRRVPVMIELKEDKEYIKSYLNKIDVWLGTVQSGISNRDKRLVYMYLSDVYDFVNELFNISQNKLPLGKMGEKKVVNYDDPLIKKNWEYFCKLMDIYGYDCVSFRDRFEMIADPNIDEDTFMYAVEQLVEDIHREILNQVNMITVEEIGKEKGKRISLKIVNQGVSAMRVKISMAYGAVREGNLIELLRLLIDIKSTLEKLIRYMERDPDIREFKKLRSKGV